MDCQKLDETLYELVSGGLDDAARAACEAHAGGCPRCTREIADYRATVQLLAVTKNPEMPDSFWERQRSRVMEVVHRALAMRPWNAPPLSLALLLVAVALYVLAGIDAFAIGQHQAVATDSAGTSIMHLTLIPLYAGLLALALYSFRDRPLDSRARR